MAGIRRVNSARIAKDSGRIKLAATPAASEEPMLVRFEHADSNKYNFHRWQQTELKALIEFFKALESQKWLEVRANPKYRYHPIKRSQLKPTVPVTVGKEETIFELRVGSTTPKRVFAFRSGRYMNLIWCDRNHEVFPEGKNL